MNGSDDEQHDAHVKVLSYTDERDAAYRAYVERVCSAWKDAPPTSPSELLLAPGRTLGAAPARSRPRPDRNTVGSAAVATIAVTPRTPMPGMAPTRRLTSFERY